MIGSLIDGALGLKWKIFTGLGAAGTLVAGFFWLTASIENRSLTKTITNRDATIERLNRDYATLNAEHQRQIDDLRKKADADAAKLADTQARLAAVQSSGSQARSASDHIMKAPPQGSTLEQRVLDVDARILETLK